MAMQCLADAWPAPILQTCALIETTVRADWVDKTSDTRALESYLQTIHYLSFTAIAIAHATFLLNWWPDKSRNYYIHRRVSQWCEIIAYMVIGGMVQPFVVMLTNPLHIASHNRAALDLLTVGLLFFVKGVTHLSMHLTHNKLLGALQWTHLFLIAFLIWDVDRDDSFFISQLYRFGASAYTMAVALAINRMQVKERWLKRGSELGMHLCLFAAHVMLTYIASIKPLILLQWTVAERADADMPVWRLMIWDWTVVALHVIVQVVLAILYATDTTKRHTRAWRQRQARLSSIVKWTTTALLLAVMIILLLVGNHIVVPDRVALRNCSAALV